MPNNYTSNRLKIASIHSKTRNVVDNNTKGALLWTRFTGGLSNQRIRMKDSIYLAAKLNRTIIIIPWIYSREKFISNWNKAPWKMVPIMQVYDVDYLILCLAKQGIRALHPCLPRYCLPGFVAPILDKNAIENMEHASLPFVIGNFDPIFHGLSPSKNVPRHRIDTCITWSSNIESLGKILLEDIRSLTKTSDFSNVFGLHLRVEEDFLTYIAELRGNGKNDQIVNSTLIVDEITNGALHCFHTHFKYVNFSQSWIYIATGEHINSVKLKNILKSFPFIITKDNLTHEINDMGEDYQAALDSYILEELNFFVGFSESTFSTQVAENRRLKYLPSALYHISRPNKCPKFEIWDRW